MVFGEVARQVTRQVPDDLTCYAFDHREERHARLPAHLLARVLVAGAELPAHAWRQATSLAHRAARRHTNRGSVVNSADPT